MTVCLHSLLVGEANFAFNRMTNLSEFRECVPLSIRPSALPSQQRIVFSACDLGLVGVRNRTISVVQLCQLVLLESPGERTPFSFPMLTTVGAAGSPY